jgi:VWFA-related protein
MTLAPGGDEVVFRSEVSLVRVDTQVVDRDNRAITGLRLQDFVLREQGQPQQIRNFAYENMPADVLLLLDVSASMRPHVERIASAAHQALRVLKDEDRVAIMVFDRSSRLRLPFRNGRDDVEREMESLLNQETFNGGTDITRGLLDAINYVAREGRRDARRAIVIVTDDETERNRDVDGVSRALTKADTVLSLLLAPDAMAGRSPGMGGGRRGGGGTSGGTSGGTWPGGGPMGGPLGGIILGRRGGPSGGRGPTVMRSHTQSAGTAEIARRSGGDSLPVDDASALETTLARIRRRYALYFHLPEGVRPGEERAIEVDLADAARQRYPGAEVRYRRVYFAPNGPPDGSRPGLDPTLVSRVPVNAPGGSTQTAAVSDTPRPAVKRRPGVDASGPRDGPLNSATSPTAGDTPPEGGAASQEVSRHVDEPSRESGPIDPAKMDQKQRCGGWRRVDEPTPQPCPSNTNPAPK